MPRPVAVPLDGAPHNGVVVSVVVWRWRRGVVVAATLAARRGAGGAVHHLVVRLPPLLTRDAVVITTHVSNPSSTSTSTAQHNTTPSDHGCPVEQAPCARLHKNQNTHPHNRLQAAPRSGTARHASLTHTATSQHTHTHMHTRAHTRTHPLHELPRLPQQDVLQASCPAAHLRSQGRCLPLAPAGRVQRHRSLANVGAHQRCCSRSAASFAFGLPTPSINAACWINSKFRETLLV